MKGENMKIIITGTKPKTDGLVDPRFGRAQFFILMDTITHQWEAFENPAIAKSGGAGVAAAQFIIDNQVDAVISGDFGPNASRALSGADVKMFLFSPEVDTVQSAVNLFKKDKLQQFK